MPTSACYVWEYNCHTSCTSHPLPVAAIDEGYHVIYLHFYCSLCSSLASATILSSNAVRRMGRGMSFSDSGVADSLDSLKNLTRRSRFERSLLLSWEVAMSVFLVQVEVLSVARLAGTGARKTRKTRTSGSVVGFMQQRPSRLRDMCRQRGKDMAFDMLFIEHSHLIGKDVSAFFIISIRASCSFLQVSPLFSHKKL